MVFRSDTRRHFACKINGLGAVCAKMTIFADFGLGDAVQKSVVNSILVVKRDGIFWTPLAVMFMMALIGAKF
jgi:hypothetical protein